MSNIVEKFNEVTHAKVINAFLLDGKSHRSIQEEILNIPAPARGGGFRTMEILHYYDIYGDKKGILNQKPLSEELKNATGMYKYALELIELYI
jgi:putative restriction endonuclease